MLHVYEFGKAAYFDDVKMRGKVNRTLKQNRNIGKTVTYLLVLLLVGLVRLFLACLLLNVK